MEPLGEALSLAELRRSYRLAGLTEDELAPDPFAQFGRWLTEALAAGLPEPNAMVVATADAVGQPSARMVLLKGYDAGGFVFYTNYLSRKGAEIAVNPRASLVFPWLALERQVIVVGDVERVDAAECDAYWGTRPRGSQLGAWASEQSAPMDRARLEQRYAAAERRWPGDAPIPRPSHWGGLRVLPRTVEFWQGRPNRLHDRLRYARADLGWQVERLAP